MFFEELDQDELARFESLGKALSFKPHDAVVAEGRAGSSFYLILSGKVEVRKSQNDGTSARIVDLGPGDLIGEIGFLGIETRSASVVALTDCEILEFERSEFETLIVSQPLLGLKIYRGIARELARRLSNSDRNLMDKIGWSMGRSRSDAELPFGSL